MATKTIRVRPTNDKNAINKARLATTNVPDLAALGLASQKAFNRFFVLSDELKQAQAMAQSAFKPNGEPWGDDHLADLKQQVEDARDAVTKAKMAHRSAEGLVLSEVRTRDYATAMALAAALGLTHVEENDSFYSSTWWRVCGQVNASCFKKTVVYDPMIERDHVNHVFA